LKQPDNTGITVFTVIMPLDKIYCYVGETLLNKSNLCQLMELTETLDNTNNEELRGGLFRPGQNCWSIYRSRRVAFLIDAEAYFKAFYETVKRAERSILIVGWDIDSRVNLLRNNSNKRSQEFPTKLGDFLNTVVWRKKGLKAHILTWDFAMVFALGRELLPIFRLPWKTSRHLHFRLDGEHPVGACHHQKIVVVDDTVAFVGGMDLSKRRWDTPQHKADDERRVQPGGFSYPPVHDVQMLVDGEAAAALGKLARERWKHATGQPLEFEGDQNDLPRRTDPWPLHVQPDIENVDVAIARTQSKYKGQKEIREVETLYLDTIKKAQRFIYLENQYLTSHAIGEALKERLLENDGPEIVLVLPEKCDGWLEQTTMGALRHRILWSLRQIDRNKRLAVYYPCVPSLGEQRLNVHAKLMISDDKFLRIGSANLSNRSMGVDTECDLAIEWQGNPHTFKAIAELRHALLGEHLGVEPKKIAKVMDEVRSLIETIESVRRGDHTLKPLEIHPNERVEDFLTATEFVDPEEPIEPEGLVKEFLPEESSGFSKKRIWGLAFFVTFMVGLASAWQWTPLSQLINVENIQRWASLARDYPAGPMITVGLYGVASLAIVPVTVMIVVTAFIFGPLKGAIYALLGCLFAAALTYYLGRYIGRDTVRRLTGTRVNRLSRRLGRHGLIAFLTVRLLPLAPFTTVNMVAGASHIRFRDFFLGTVLGMAPGIVAITVFEHQLEKAIYNPGAKTFSILLLVLGLIILGAVTTRRWLGNKGNDASGQNK
jgi:phosphatidylserine/phosphatidylglycerophosphate/cardiolipin synthase-like enzyme/uncharacterized membrane protein YdjX (TVP38/TMEM64 family)